MCVWYDCTSGILYFSASPVAVQMSAPGEEQWIRSGGFVLRVVPYKKCSSVS